MTGILLLCVASSARSQIAAGLARARFGDRERDDRARFRAVRAAIREHLPELDELVGGPSKVLHQGVDPHAPDVSATESAHATSAPLSRDANVRVARGGGSAILKGRDALGALTGRY